MKKKPHRPGTKLICTVCIVFGVLSTAWNAYRSVALFASLIPDETFLCDGMTMTAEDGTEYSLHMSHSPWWIISSAPQKYRWIGTARGNILGEEVYESVYSVYDCDTRRYTLHVGNTYGNMMPQHDFYRVDFQAPEVTLEVVDAAGFAHRNGYTIAFEQSVVDRLFEILQRPSVDSDRYYNKESNPASRPDTLYEISLYDYDQDIPLQYFMRFIETKDDRCFLEDGDLYEVTREEMEEILSDITAAGKRVRYPSQLKKP